LRKGTKTSRTFSKGGWSTYERIDFASLWAFVKNLIKASKALAREMGLVGQESFQAIAEVRDPAFWARWNVFIRSFGTNAFYLGGFVEYYMGTARSQGWTPRLCFMTVDGRMVGAAALLTRGVPGGRTATSLLPREYGTDFVVEPKHRQAFVHTLLRFLVKELKCQFFDLILPSESPNLQSLMEASRTLGCKFETPLIANRFKQHRVIEVPGSWDKYRETRGKDFDYRHRRIEELLKKDGELEIRRLDLDGPEIVNIIKTIERNSWKDAWRLGQGAESDPHLPAFFTYWNRKSSENTPLPKVWLLELNGEPIAHHIVLQLNGTALLCKTSFDQRHTKKSPGIYINNLSVQDLINSREVSKIDFLTDLPYQQRWTSLCLPRERVLVSRSIPLLSGLVRTLRGNTYVRTAYRALRRSPIGRWEGQNP
jgi:hypothetical protein